MRVSVRVPLMPAPEVLLVLELFTISEIRLYFDVGEIQFKKVEIRTGEQKDMGGGSRSR